jgi:hypothetical protein
VRFRDRESSATGTRGDGYQAGREHGSEIAGVRNGNAKTARARKYDSALDKLTTKENLSVLSKAKMAIKPQVLVGTMARSQRPPSSVSLSPSVEILRL